MAKAKKTKSPSPARKMTGYIENAGIVIDQPITRTLEENYMPYAMSVIISRAIPEIDGFKPSHRKILYTMYKMKLLTGARTKSANIVGQTMRLNPHGDMAIYETMVRLSRGYEALLYPYVDSKGNFGKAYSRDMAFAASRYTEAKLEPICNELFGDIDKDTVDFVDNFDNTMKEPALLPVSFPTILVNSNMGIAVGMASSICSFNIGEVCETAVALIKDPEHDILSTLQAPDFPGGGYILYDEAELRKIYATGRGAVRVRCRYAYDKENTRIQYEVNRYAVGLKPDKKSLRAFTKQTRGSGALSLAFSGVEGVGLGLLGLGLPDIPILTATLLRSLYELATSYGYDYAKPEERFYLLMLIEGSMSYGDKLDDCQRRLDEFAERDSTEYTVFSEDEVIKQLNAAASALADETLFLKFVQGIPIVGVVGGLSNPVIMSRVRKFALLNYQYRMLKSLARS